MTLISDHTYSGSRFREFAYGNVTISLIENWAGKRLLAFSPALPPAVQRHVAASLGVDLSLPYKTFNARGTAFYLQTASTPPRKAVA